MANSVRKILIFRLSSLGDIVMATSALEVECSPEKEIRQIDWVVKKEYMGLLEGHPKLRKVWGFGPETDLSAWMSLCRQLWDEGYDEIWDLHRTLRTKVAVFLFWYWGVLESGRLKKRKLYWKTFSKERWKQWGYFLFKKAWPKALRPIATIIKSGKTAGGTGGEKPNLRFLTVHAKDIAIPFENYFCVMPSAKWSGKKWSVESYFVVITQIKLTPVILGAQGDLESARLVERLKQSQIPHFSGVGIWTLPENARVLSGAVAYLGSDTVFAHLAEAVGTPAVVIYGPTAPDAGSGPWRPESQAVEAEIWCHPCGSYGKSCHRLLDRHLCLTKVAPHRVSEALRCTIALRGKA